MTEKKMIQLQKPNIGNDELELVKQVIESGYLVEGPMVREFESFCEDFLNVKHAISCTSWTSGAELVFRAIGLKKKDEVICSDFSHPATALAVITAGGTPVFVDVDLESRNSTIDNILPAISSNTKVIQPVSIFGNPVDIDPINDVAKDKDLLVVDDAACTLGSYHKDKAVGGLTDFTIFSFHPRKVFTCGDGGLITTNHDSLAKAIRSMKVFGAEDGKFSNWGTNQRMSNVHGALLLGQVRRINEIVSSRRERAKIYDTLLEGVDGLQRPQIAHYSKSNYQTYAVLLDFYDYKKEDMRKIIMEKMREKNIQTQIGTYSISGTPFLQKYKVVGDLANSKRLESSLLSLPLHHDLTREDQERVVMELENIIQTIK